MKGRHWVTRIYLAGFPLISACRGSEVVVSVDLFTHIVLGILEISFFVVIIAIAFGKVQLPPLRKKPLDRDIL
jgi:hypothetical protein